MVTKKKYNASLRASTATIFSFYLSSISRFSASSRSHNSKCMSRLSCSTLTKIGVHSEADREDDRETVNTSISTSREIRPRERGRRLENTLVSHVDVSSGFATISSISPNGLPRCVAGGQKCTSRKHNGALESDPLGFSGIVIALWEQLSLRALCPPAR